METHKNGKKGNNNKTGATVLQTLVALLVISACAAISLLSPAVKKTSEIKDGLGGEMFFSGIVRDGKLEGQAFIEFEDGDTYDGGMQNGVFSGEGTYTSIGRFTLTGSFRNGDIVTGALKTANGVVMNIYETTGDNTQEKAREYTVTSPDGSVYSGSIGLLGQRGSGEFTSKDGRYKYAGSFEAGLPNGTGYLTLDGKPLFSGLFKDGRFNGYGVYTSPEGWRYEGNFTDGCISDLPNDDFGGIA